MPSTFALQLGQIAAKSSNELDLKAQKASHSESLIFERQIAGSQDIDSIYQICLEGYRELCQLDSRFVDFEGSLFSTQSKSQDRSRMTAQENEFLDNVLELFLGLVGSRLLLRPAVKAVEWLVRRFKVHTHNTSVLLSTFLPYHETPIFRHLLSIIPANLPSEYKFLNPYLKTATNPPRHAITYAVTNSDGLFNTLNAYTLQVCNSGSSHPTLMSFWGSILVEAVAGRLMLAQSGRKEIQEQRQQDVLMKVIPLLQEGFLFSEFPDMIMVCYTITMILASKCDLADNVIDSLMEVVAGTITSTEDISGLTCLSILASRRSRPLFTRGLISSVLKIQNIEVALEKLALTFPVENLVQSLVTGALDGLNQKNYISWISFIERLLHTSMTICDQTSAVILLKLLLSKIEQMSDHEELLKTHLVTMIRRLYDSDTGSAKFKQAIGLTGFDNYEIEFLLGATVTPRIDQAAPSESGSMLEPDTPSLSNELEEALDRLPERIVDQHSFLTPHSARLYKILEATFELSCDHQNGLGRFETLPIWLNANADSALYISFLLRVACSNQRPSYRSSALRLVARNITGRKNELDTQALVPYIFVCLADSAQTVRRAAAEVFVAITDLASKHSTDGKNHSPWGAQDLYESVQSSKDDEWLLPQQLLEIIQDAFLPVLEECIIDSTQVGRAILGALNGSSSANTVTVVPGARVTRLKKPLRKSLFNLLTQHLLATPLLTVKIGLIRLLDGVDKVGSISKTAKLFPALISWVGLSKDRVIELTEAECLSLFEVDRALAIAISTAGLESISQLLQNVTNEGGLPRSGFVDALFSRIIVIWKDLNLESRSAVATQLFELSTSPVSSLRYGAKNVLQSSELPTTALISMLEMCQQATTKLQDTKPARKKRRTSHSQSSIPVAAVSNEGDSVVAQLAFILELIDGSQPQNRPEILGELFRILSFLQFMRQNGQGQLPYLLRLCLGSLLAIVKQAANSRNPRIDLSVVRVDLVTECVRNVDNAQVQNTALLLIAALAAIEPEHVLHSVMPIFTFMGNSVLAKKDEHSVYVTNQTLDQVIPPLVNAVKRKDGENLIRPMSDLLSSFTAAFDHIPQYRRLNLFQRLLSRLGVDDYTYALIAMLAVRKSDDPEMTRFFIELLDRLDIRTQLLTCRNLLLVLKDIFSSNPDDAEILVGISSTSSVSEKTAAARAIVSTAIHLVKNKTLRKQVNESHKLSRDATAKVQQELLTSFKQILELLRDSSVDPKLRPDLNLYLEVFLSLPPLAEYFDSLPQVLQEVDQTLRVDVLSALESRLKTPSIGDGKAQAAGLGFLPLLANYLITDGDILLKVAVMACIDRIAELYGRRDVPIVLNVAAIISQEQCLGSENEKVQVAALLSIASLLEILKEAVIPIVPELIPKIFQLLEVSIEDNADAKHNACFSLLAALVTHVPFMISEEYVDRILTLCSDSANADLDDESHQNRRDFLRILSRNLEVGLLVPGLARTWKNAVENDIAAIKDVFSILSTTIERSSKTTVLKYAEKISSFFLQVADHRHIQFMVRTDDSYTDAEVDEIEASLHEVMVKFIYKLNDNAFRPIFADWVDWAVECPGVPSIGLERAKMLRQTSLFGFMVHFFTTLKSIVTSYSLYLLEPAVTVLQHFGELIESVGTPSVPSLDADGLNLYLSALSMLTAAASGDQDAFFASPAHFSPLNSVLVGQLSLAASKPLTSVVYSHVIPALISLATAVIDTPAHHLAINKLICNLRHSEHVGVRLATIKAQVALTDSEEVGEEWVGNIVGHGGETMVYVNEMLEDDDEAVEKEVRKWVRKVRDMVGEDVFET